VLAYGLIIGPGAYLRSGWNIMDGFLVLVSIVSTIIMLTASGGAKIFGVLRVLRLLRALRPLRYEWMGRAAALNFTEPCSGSFQEVWYVGVHSEHIYLGLLAVPKG